MAPMTGVALAERRDPRQWLDDMAWHRRMFAESQFRWAPEDPTVIALTWTRGQLVFESFRDLTRLDRQLHALGAFAAQIDHAMVPLLEEAQRSCTTREWGRGLQLIGLTPQDVQTLREGAEPPNPWHPEVRRATSGIPVPNPFSLVWELRQIRAMYRGAEAVLEDAFCDLAVELMSDLHRGSAGGDSGRDPQERLRLFSATLQRRIHDQRASRGEPGDSRRIPIQIC